AIPIPSGLSVRKPGTPPTDGDIEAWAATLDDAKLMAPLAYRTRDGMKHDHPTWWAVTHFFNHQTHHRGQVTALLTRLGVDPGVTDVVALLRDGAI
ncbi:MAG: DinB family protein, partial [Myxococcota bacterium]